MYYGLTESEVLFYTGLLCLAVICLAWIYLMRYKIGADYRAKKEEARRLYAGDPKGLARELRAIEAEHDRKMTLLLRRGSSRRRF